MFRSILFATLTVLSVSLHAQDLVFSDVTQASNLLGTQALGPASTDFMGGGGAGDFDRDGDQDLFMPMGPLTADRLMLNDGTGTFTDVAAAWGCAAVHMGSGMAVGDYDDDGWLDIYLLSHGGPAANAPGFHRLYHNVGGAGFAQVATAAGVKFTSLFLGDGYGACFGDDDMDGDLDLVATGWLPAALGNRIFRNNGNGTFTNVTSSAISGGFGLVGGFTPQLFDMDGDLDPELLLAADFHTSRYFVNNGDGTFTNTTVASGTGLDSNGMGATLADFDGDLLPDWYVTSIWEDGGCSSGNTLYLNQGANTFSETSVPAGVNDGGWGWGVVSTDLDLDGDVDIAENNGYLLPLTDTAEPLCSHDPLSQWVGEPAYLWLNDGDGSHFTESHAAAGLDHALDGRGILNFDMDADGDQELVLFTNNGPIAVFRNDLSGPGHNWLRVFLSNLHKPGVPPDGLGSKVYATVGGVTRFSPVMDKPSYVSSCEQSALFGLGSAATVEQLRVEWPDGTVSYLDHVPANQTLDVAHHGWKRLAGGLAGTGGIQPQLSGSGDLSGGDLVSLQLSDAKPGSAAVLFVGLSAVDAPFKGGVLVPAVTVVLPGLSTSGAGSLLLLAPWPTGLPPQLSLYLQVWVADPGAVHGVAGSNAVQLTTP